MPEWKPRNTERARDLRNSATSAERKLWAMILRSRLGAKFSRQMPVGPYYADFLCRELKLVIELDGLSHDLRPDHDERRDGFFRSEGFTVLRFANEDVMNNREGVLTEIAKAIEDLRG